MQNKNVSKYNVYKHMCSEEVSKEKTSVIIVIILQTLKSIYLSIVMNNPAT